MPTTDREKLRDSRFLHGTPETALHQLAKIVETKTFRADELLFEEGTAREFMAVIVSGAVAIEKRHDARPVRLVTLGVGEAVGEGILLDDSPHGTSARAISTTTAFVLSGEQIKTLIREAPAVYAALVARAARAISQRLAATDPARLVGPCMHEASSCTTPSSLGNPPSPTDWSLGSRSTTLTPETIASSVSPPRAIMS